MGRTTKDKVIAKIKSAPKGRLFIISDFESLGSYASVRKILYELEKAGLLNRVVPGIYQKPNFNEFLQLSITPSPTEIAEVLARKNKWSITPAKDLALNSLGLDTQVPNTYEFISDGPSKKIKLDDNREIHFRHVTQREVLMNPTSSLVVEAFKALGKDDVTDDVLKQVKSKLSPKQLAQLSKDVASSRIWIREKVRRMNEVLE